MPGAGFSYLLCDITRPFIEFLTFATVSSSGTESGVMGMFSSLERTLVSFDKIDLLDILTTARYIPLANKVGLDLFRFSNFFF